MDVDRGAGIGVLTFARVRRRQTVAGGAVEKIRIEGWGTRKVQSVHTRMGMGTRDGVGLWEWVGMTKSGSSLWRKVLVSCNYSVVSAEETDVVVRGLEGRIPLNE